MSRVAAAALGLVLFLIGCGEQPRQTAEPKVSQSNPISISPQETAQQTDSSVFLDNDPNALNTLRHFPEEVTSAAKPHVEYHPFVIPPDPNTDYKIIAIRPNPDIDYKIMNPRNNIDRLLRQFKKQAQEDSERKNQELQRKYLEQLEQSRQKTPQELEPLP